MTRCTHHLAAIIALVLQGLFPLTAAAQSMPPDLSYVETDSSSWSRFYAWVDTQETSGPPFDYGFSAKDAAYAFRVSGEARFCTLAVFLAEEQVFEAEAKYAGCPSSDTSVCDRPDVAFDSYLYVGDLVSDLALTYDWCAAFITPAQQQRWAVYGEQAVWNVWNPSEAQWGGQSFPWSGWSISNPGNNYHFSFLEATLYWASATGSPTWMTFLSNQKIPPLITYYQNLPGGGSREGTAYGLSHRRLFHFYRMWKEATGQDLAAMSTHARDELDYWVHATVPTFEYTAAIGDQARISMPQLYDYHRALVLEGSFLDPTTASASRAYWWLNRIPIDQMISGFNYRNDLLPVGTEQPPVMLSHHATGVGQLFARTSWAVDATWIAFVAGTYDESHAHNDQGSFTLFKDSWLAITENVYTHSGIQQGVEVHNLVRFVDGGSTLSQSFGSESSMTSQWNGDVLTINADLTNAYSNTPVVSSWLRTAELAVGRLAIHDTFAIDPAVEAIWQINTPVEPTVVGGDIVAGDLVIHPVIPAAPTISILDWTTVVDGETYYSGWKVELKGGTTEYRVELNIPSVVGAPLFRDGFESGTTSMWSTVGRSTGDHW